MTSLNLSRKNLGAADAELLAAAMTKFMGSLTVADMRYNELDIESATILANIAKQKTISLCGITPDQTQADFSPTDSVHGPFLKPADAVLLTADLAVRGSLTSIDVRKNSITGDGASQLSAAVLANVKIEKFNEIPIKEMRTDSITELNLNHKFIGIEGGMVVAGLMPVMGSLTAANLLSNSFDVDSAAMLLKIKEEKPQLLTLCGLTHEETKLDLHDKGLGPADAMLLAPEITVMGSLTHIE